MVSLSKKQSRIIAVSMIVLFFLFGITFSGQNKASRSATPTSSREEAKSEENNKASSRIILDNFHRNETKGGKTLWEVKAKRGLYLPEEHKAELEDSHLWFYRTNGDVVKLNSAEALLSFDSMSLINAELFNGVVVELNDELKLTTSVLEYKSDGESLHSPGRVHIEGQGIDIEGEEMDVELVSQEVRIHRRVKSVIQPRENKL